MGIVGEFVGWGGRKGEVEGGGRGGCGGDRGVERKGGRGEEVVGWWGVGGSVGGEGGSN